MNQWILALAFAIVAILVYKLWKPMLKPPKAKLQPNEARIYFFYTDWCGFSQKAMPEWEKLESGPRQFGNTEVSFIRVNAEKDRATADLYEINAYPTIKLETSQGLSTFDQGAPTAEKLTQYLRMKFGKEA